MQLPPQENLGLNKSLIASPSVLSLVSLLMGVEGPPGHPPLPSPAASLLDRSYGEQKSIRLLGLGFESSYNCAS